ncbi:hypothetical protein WN51_02716 [Melipona quadrifasciata]|uniref:Uncharacterized protein n=1 Tax=Melipona quadrifasciata TaxID=166423 RepID=A0A0N0U7E5_9HYME|nr:hypothetical protein WN51_02716 [Melipona quadrifasciata]
MRNIVPGGFVVRQMLSDVVMSKIQWLISLSGLLIELLVSLHSTLLYLQHNVTSRRFQRLVAQGVGLRKRILSILVLQMTRVLFRALAGPTLFLRTVTYAVHTKFVVTLACRNESCEGVKDAAVEGILGKELERESDSFCVSSRNHCLDSSSEADGSDDSLPQTLVITKPTRLQPPILAGFRTLCCLTSKIGRTSTLGAQPLAACASRVFEAPKGIAIHLEVIIHLLMALRLPKSLVLTINIDIDKSNFVLSWHSFQLTLTALLCSEIAFLFYGEQLSFHFIVYTFSLCSIPFCIATQFNFVANRSPLCDRTILLHWLMELHYIPSVVALNDGTPLKRRVFNKGSSSFFVKFAYLFITMYLTNKREYQTCDDQSIAKPNLNPEDRYN